MNDSNYSGVLDNNVYLTAYNKINIPNFLTNMCSQLGITLNSNPNLSYESVGFSSDELEFYGCASKHQMVLEKKNRSVYVRL